MRIVSMTLALSLTLLAGCAATSHRPLSPAPPIGSAPAWAALVTPLDRARLEALADTWQRARASVPRRLADKLAAEGALVQPAAALDAPSLPPGPYYCRLVRLGGPLGLTTFKPDFCTIDATPDTVSFTKQTGVDAPGGWLFADSAKRQVFLGTFRPAKVARAPSYSANPALAVAGVVERVGPFRWRLVLTRAGKGALLDVYELVPVTPAVKGAVPAVPG